MAYVAPYVDASGLHLPTYPEIRDALIDEARAIYGIDLHAEPDSQDYQWIAIVAEKLYDAMLITQAAYNSRSPSTAVGAALSSLVKINGIRPKRAVASVADVLVTGRIGASIPKGVVGDEAGYRWMLEENLTIPETGTLWARATCTTMGIIEAPAHSITKILTPTQGWMTVSNPNPALPGTVSESDAQLRARQAYSVAKPSRTVMDGLKSGIAELPGVTRFRIYENDTHEFDARGLPPHSIAAVVEGGEAKEIAESLFLRKTPGGGTVGDVEIPISDAYGPQLPVRFSRPTYADIDVRVRYRPMEGFTSATAQKIKQAIAEFLSSYAIGSPVMASALWSVALSACDDLRNPTFALDGIDIARRGETPAQADLPMAYYEVSRGDTEAVNLEVSAGG